MPDASHDGDATQSHPIRLAAEVIAGQNPGLSPAESLELARLSGGCPGLAIGMAQDAMRPLYHDLTAALGEYHGNPAERVQRALILAGRLHEHKEFGGSPLKSRCRHI